MQTFSANKLLRMTLTGEHLPICPHKNDKTPGYMCLCWRFGVQEWDRVMKIRSKTKVRKSRPPKIHMDGYKCSAKSPVSKTTLLADLTCKQCIRGVKEGKVQATS